MVLMCNLVTGFNVNIQKGLGLSIMSVPQSVLSNNINDNIYVTETRRNAVLVDL